MADSPLNVPIADGGYPVASISASGQLMDSVGRQNDRLPNAQVSAFLYMSYVDG